MRIFDQIVAGVPFGAPEHLKVIPPFSPAIWKDILLGGEALFADEAYEVWYQTEISEGTFHNVRAPFDVFWIEGKIPDRDPGTPVIQLASLWLETKTHLKRLEALTGIPVQPKAYTVVDHPEMTIGENVIGYDVFTFAATTRKEKVLYLGFTRVLCDEAGTIIGGTYNIDDADKDVRMDTMGFQSVLIGAFSITLANCHNVNMVKPELTPAEEKMSKAHRKRHGQPKVRYYILEIDPNRTPSRRSDGDGTGPKKALHICRGHFRKYGIDGRAPLFGRITGVFWVPAHVKGDRKYGEVIKDYKIKETC